MGSSHCHLSRAFLPVATLFVSLFLFSCEEVIDLDLDKVDQRIVIEGIVADNPSASRVTISFSESIYTRTQPRKTTGAVVTLSDDLGNSEVLREVQTGMFVPISTVATVGREYTLRVAFGGVEYVAASRMPEAMALDSVRSSFSGYDWFFGSSTTLTYYLTNRPGVEEYCMIKTYYQNDSKYVWTLYSDKNTDGKQVALESPSFQSTASSVRVAVVALDRASYEYFRKLQEIVGDGSLDVPDLLRLNEYNPRSNFTNEALGYFSAQAQRERVVSLR